MTVQVSGWQSDPWQVVVGTRRNVRAIQSPDFDILPFVLLSTAGGFERKTAFYFCTWPVLPQNLTAIVLYGQKEKVKLPIILEITQWPHSLSTMVMPPG